MDKFVSKQYNEFEYKDIFTHLISISLKVVNIALTFWASFNLCAIFNRILFILTRCSVLVPVISLVGSWGGTLTVAASRPWACLIAATGMLVIGCCWGDGGFAGGAVGDGGGSTAAGLGGVVAVGIRIGHITVQNSVCFTTLHALEVHWKSILLWS